MGSTLYKDYANTRKMIEERKNKKLESYQQVELIMQGINSDEDFGTINIDWDDYDPIPYDIESHSQPPILKCAHVWKATVLITTTVYDCKYCGIKKENFNLNFKEKP